MVKLRLLFVIVIANNFYTLLTCGLLLVIIYNVENNSVCE